MAYGGKKADKKIPNEAPMIITFAHKSRMTLAQLTSAFIPDPMEAEERHKVFGNGDYSTYSFIGDKDKIGQTWIMRLSDSLDDVFNPNGSAFEDVIEK